MSNQTFCNKFEPTILEGQLCYSLDIAKIDTRPTKEGKINGLFLLLDPRPFQASSYDRNIGTDAKKQPSFEVHIHTLAQYKAFGPAAYGMSALKKMTGTKSFEQIPDKQKECRVHNREDCQSQHFLDQTKNNCGCVPWALVTDSSTKKVRITINIDLFTKHRHRRIITNYRSFSLI